MLLIDFGITEKSSGTLQGLYFELEFILPHCGEQEKEDIYSRTPRQNEYQKKETGPSSVVSQQQASKRLALPHVLETSPFPCF